MTGCAQSTQLSKIGPSSLAVASCPALTPLTGKSFGATSAKLVEVAQIYHECRKAALAIPEKKK